MQSTLLHNERKRLPSTVDRPVRTMSVTVRHDCLSLVVYILLLVGSTLGQFFGGGPVTNWWCYRCSLIQAGDVCPTCGLKAPLSDPAQQTVGNLAALHSTLLQAKQRLGHLKADLTRSKHAGSLVSQLGSRLFRRSQTHRYVPDWWCYRCGLTLALFTCTGCGLRYPGSYHDAQPTVDDLKPRHPKLWNDDALSEDTKSKLFTHVEKVGYLNRGENYRQGEVSDGVLERLISLVRRPVVHFYGYHDCDLDPCWLKQPQPQLRYKGIAIPNRCSTDILVPHNTGAYIAPALILHYILFHQYLPPTGFLEAVQACPDAGSSEYLRAIERMCPPTIRV